MTSRRRRAALVGAAMLCLAGCATLPLGAPVASMDNLQRLRTVPLRPMALGRFVPGPGLAADADRVLMLRTNRVTAPSGSFALHLRDTLGAELRAAGALDPAADAVVEGELLENRLEAPSDEGRGELAARVRVRLDGRDVFDKTLRTSAVWPSSFVGVAALPDAMNAYNGLHRALVARLLDDPDFRAALRH